MANVYSLTKSLDTGYDPASQLRSIPVVQVHFEVEVSSPSIEKNAIKVEETLDRR